jgi:hypothetical protein
LIEMTKKSSAVLIVAAAFALGCDATYSDGDRVGVVTKLSYKGVVNKSWEGELAMDNFKPAPGSSATSNIFEFSVLDDGMRKTLQDDMNAGTRVKLHYRQQVLNSGCTHDSDYIITSAVPVASAASSAMRP